MGRPYHFPATGIYEETKEVYTLLDKAMLDSSVKLLVEALSGLEKVLGSNEKEPEILEEVLNDISMARSDLSIVLQSISK